MFKFSKSKTSQPEAFEQDLAFTNKVISNGFEIEIRHKGQLNKREIELVLDAACSLLNRHK